ncbi:MAG: RNA polymerase sigma factor [Mangrovibacterium sp.]
MNLDQELAKSICRGNKDAYEILFKTYYRRLCAYAVSFVSRNEIAEDIVTDVFLKLWEKRESLTITGSISSYLFQSVKNSGINYLIREKNRKQMISENEMKLLDLKISYPVSDEHPYARLIGQELEKKIREGIDKLPERSREIFYLSRFEEFSHKEIAEKLGIAENTVKVHIYKSLIKLRDELKDYLPLIFIKFPDFF